MTERAVMPPQPSAPRRWRLFVVGGGAIGVAVLLVVMLSGSKPPVEESAVPVVVRQPSAIDRAQRVVVSGEVESARSANVAFQVAGRVARIWHQEGDYVAVGDPIAEIDSTIYALQLTMAAAATRLAEDQYRRLSEMKEKQGVAPADFVKVETAYQQAQAQEGMARKQLSESRLVAPIAGAIARRGIDVGEQAAPGYPVFTIVGMNPLQVRAGVPEAEIGRVRVGQMTDIVVPALSNRTFQGKVSLVGVAADPVSRTYSVKVTVPNPDGVLRPGMIAEARIQQDARLKALTVPGTAIVRDPDGATLVFVYFQADQRVHSQRVTVGSVYGKEVEVTSGLTGSESVVIGGQHRVRDGSRVEVTTSGSEARLDGRKGP
jgi:membrane fusion protein, multidrug efflux system